MLTEKTIKEAEARAKPYVIWDEKIKGFGMRVFPAGRRSYILMYRINGVLKLVTLARIADLSLKDARARAASELSTARLGKTDLATRKKDERNAPTIAELWARFENEYAPERIDAGRMTKRTLQEYRKQYTRLIAPSLSRVKVKDISRGDIEKLARRWSHVPVQRNRTLGFLSRLFTLAETWELRGQNTNPVRGVTRARETARDRVLAPSEMQRLNHALMQLEGRHLYEVKAIYVAALTGLRISEVLSLQWQHVDLETGRANLPTTKTGKRALVLAGAVRGMLGALPRVHGSAFVFPSLYQRRGDCSITYKTTRDVFERACQSAGLDDVRLHDLRRSLATNLAGQGVSAFLLRDVLGHASITMSNRYVQQASAGLIAASELAASITVSALTGQSLKK